MWHSGSVGHHCVRASLIISQEISEGRRHPWGNRFLLTQPNCALQWTHQALIGAIGHRFPECLRFLKKEKKEKKSAGSKSALVFLSRHVPSSRMLPGLSSPDRKCSCVSPCAVPSPRWGHSGAVRLAEQRREKQSVERRKSSANSTKGFGIYLSAFEGLYPHFTALKVKPVSFNLVGERLSYFSEHAFHLLSTRLIWAFV